MNKQITRLAAALFAGLAPVWAAATTLPAYETYSAAADSGTNFFSDPAFTPLQDVTPIPGATAQISGAGYTASASTTLGSNHAYASVSSTPTNVLSAGSFSGWYDQVTITGGTGTGSAHFTVHLTGTVDVGAFGGGAGYTLGTSTVHPSELTSSLQYFNTIPPATQPWAMDAMNPIATYLLGASPYNDASMLFPSTSTDPIGGIPAIPNDSLGGSTGMGFPTPDLILTPGAGQGIDVILQGTLDFTYGEPFYLIGGLDASVFGDWLDSFCTFPGDTCTNPAKDGTGATTLDFSHSANLVKIVLPAGATTSFASGKAYNVTTVPEPGTLFLVAGGLLGLGGFARRITT